MKVNVSVEATAQEMREFLGLPNVQPLHDDILRTVRENIQRGTANFDPFGLMKPLLPAQMYSMDMMHKFWETIAKSATAKSAAGYAAKNAAEQNAESNEYGTENGQQKNDTLVEANSQASGRNNLQDQDSTEL